MKCLLNILLFVLLFWSSLSIADTDYNKATNYTTKALYKELRIGYYVQQLQERYLHDDLRKVGGYTAWLLKVGIEQRIVVEWRFP